MNNNKIKDLARVGVLALAALSIVGVGAPASAKKVAKATVTSNAATARKMAELGGKYKWGMTPDDITKVVAEELHVKFEEALKKEQDTYRQDRLRQDEKDEVEKFRTSLVAFDGKKSGWDTSLIDKEFMHRNNESMMVRWEKDQRRFLFFSDGKLYKQYIAFNAEHPAFAGKSFDDFANIIQGRYGKAQMKLAAMKTRDDVALDHLEWPPQGEYTLWAVDQTSFYGNYCLKLIHTSAVATLEKAHADRLGKGPKSSSLIDAITAPETVKGDPNADVVDSIVSGKGGKGTQK